MEERASRTAGIEIPETDEVGRAIGRAQRWFRRTLPIWASDVLMLRQSGAIDPTWPDGATDGWSHAA